MTLKARAGREGSSILVIRDKDGALSWQTIDRGGRRVRPGKIVGIEAATPQAQADHQLSLRVIERVLKAHGAKKLRKLHPVGPTSRIAVNQTRKRNAISVD